MTLSKNTISTEEQHAFSLFADICLHQGLHENLLFSPYSIQQALSLLSVNTKDEHILNELSLYTSPNMLNESLLNTKSNSLILLNKKYQSYRAYNERGTVDIFSSPEDGKQKLDSFQENFFGKVLNHISPKEEDDFDIFSILQYAAEWLTPFTKENTHSRIFHINNSIRNKRVMSMRSQFSHAYGKITNDYEIAALSGKNHSITYFIKPKTKKENILHELYDLCNHDNELKNTIDLQIPKLTLESTLNLLPAFERMGLTYLAKSHSDENYHFTIDNIIDPLRAKTKLNSVSQTVQLHLDEERAEVKAATCQMFCLVSCVPLQPLIIKMDAPYFIVIKDKTTKGKTRIVCTAWINMPDTTNNRSLLF